MRSAKKAISIITLFSLLLSTNYSICLGAMLPPAAAPLSIIQDAVSLPDARVGVTYEYQFQSEGGLAPLTWRVAQGELPPGLKLETNGRLHGIPSQAQREAFAFQIEVSDSSATPQRFAQPFLLPVQAAPLRIVTAAPKLRIVTGVADSGRNSSLTAAPMATPSPTPIPTPKPLSSQAGFQSVLMANISDTSGQPAAITRGSSAPPAIVGTMKDETVVNTSINDKEKDQEDRKDKKQLGVNPFSFIRIYEDTENGKRILIYEPTVPFKQNISKLSADKNSQLVIVPDPKLMDASLPLNNLYMTARLVSGDPAKKTAAAIPLEVEGYSKVGESQATGQTQRGMSFQSLKDIQSRLLALAFASDDILDTFYNRNPDESVECKEENPNERQQLADKDALIASLNAKSAATFTASDQKAVEALQNKLRLYEPEITSTSNFLLEDKNLEIIRIIGAEIFNLDGESLQQTAQQFKENAQTLFSEKSTPAAKNQALFILLERTKLINKAFENIKRAAISDIFGVNNVNKASYCGLDSDKKRLARRDAYLKIGLNLQNAAINSLKKLIANGSISLNMAKAEDRDLLILSIEARGSDGVNIGIPAVFEIEIKQFGPKAFIADSL